MRVLRTEPWVTPHEDVYQEDRLFSYLTRKQRDDRYDLIQLRTEPWVLKQNERRVIKMSRSWSVVLKAAERSSRDTTLSAILITWRFNKCGESR